MKQQLNQLLVVLLGLSGLLFAPFLHSTWLPIGTDDSIFFIQLEELSPPGEPGAIRAPEVVYGVDDGNGGDVGRWTLSWSSANGEPSYYELYERAGEGAWGRKSNVYSDNRYTIKDVRIAGHYYYKVRAANRGGSGMFSPVVKVTYLDSIARDVTIDVDGDGTIDPQTDGVLLSRYEAGLRDERLIADISSDALDSGRIATLLENYIAGNGIINVARSPSLAIPSNKPIEADDSIGSLAGEFRVNESGAATYNVPIATAAGVAGVVPQISIGYSSSAGNGLLGMGWNIGGLSGISRCRQTLGQDKNPMPITWSASDRFCLDGQRLILVSGSYGHANSRYKTEIDSFARITAVGGRAGHPNYFKVERKDGSVSSYGNTSHSSHSQLKNGDNEVLTWSISRFKDNIGNSILFDYEGSTGEQRIKTIGYAFEALEATSISHAKASIVFDYGTSNREDIISGYVAGHEFTTSKRLEKIITRNGRFTMREYQLRYEETTVARDSLSRLIEIKECASNGDCIKPTTFDWALPAFGEGIDSTRISGGPRGMAQSYNINHPNFTKELDLDGNHYLLDYKPIDINGDGMLDMVYLEGQHYVRQSFFSGPKVTSNQRIRYLINRGGELVPVRPRSGHLYDNSLDQRLEMHVIDYNADGRQDVMIWDPKESKWELMLSRPGSNDGWELIKQDIDFPFSDKKVTFTDINSDGLVDAVYKDQYWLLGRNNKAASSQLAYSFSSAGNIIIGTGPDISSSSVCNVNESKGRPSTEFLRFIPDINGSGTANALMKTSCILRAPRQGVVDQDVFYYVGSVIWDYNKTLTVHHHSTIPVLSALHSFADFNADGLTDIVFWNRGWHVSLSTGTGFTTTVLSDIIASDGKVAEDNRLQVADYNRDGYQDIIWQEDSKLKVKYWQSASQTFSAANDLRTVVDNATDDGKKHNHLFFDFNGDGLTDYIHFDGTSPSGTNGGTLKMYHGKTNAHGVENKIVQITNGLDAKTNIKYGAINSGGHYQRVDVASRSQTRLRCVRYETSYPDGPGRAPFKRCTHYEPYEFEAVDGPSFYSELNQPFADLDGQQRLEPETTAPVLEINGPLYVVEYVSSSAPTADDSEAQSSIRYNYSEMKIQAGGRGNLGFKTLSTIDDQTGVITTTQYRQDWPFIGYPWKTTVRSSEGHTLSYSVNQWGLVSSDSMDRMRSKMRSEGSSGLSSVQPYLKQSEEYSYNLADNGSRQGALLSKVVTRNDYDSWGNPTTINVKTYGSSLGRLQLLQTKDTNNDYGSDARHAAFRPSKIDHSNNHTA